MTESTRPRLKLKFPVKDPPPRLLKIEIPLAKPDAEAPLPSQAAPLKVATPAKPKVKPVKPIPSKIMTPQKNLLMPKEEYKILFEELCAKYPKLFDINNKRVRILATGVHLQVREELGWSPKTTRHFFFIFCQGKKYKAARIKGAKRYDLQGKVVGKVE